MAQKLVRLSQYAVEHPISVMSLRRYISQGRIQGYRVGVRLIMVDENEVDQVLFGKRIPTTSKSGGTDAA